MADLPGAGLGRTARAAHARRQRAARKATRTAWPVAAGSARVHYTDPNTGTTSVYRLEDDKKGADGDGDRQ